MLNKKLMYSSLAIINLVISVILVVMYVGFNYNLPKWYVAGEMILLSLYTYNGYKNHAKTIN